MGLERSINPLVVKRGRDGGASQRNNRGPRHVDRIGAYTYILIFVSFGMAHTV